MAEITLITGASSGFGVDLSRALAAHNRDPGLMNGAMAQSIRLTPRAIARKIAQQS